MRCIHPGLKPLKKLQKPKIGSMNAREVKCDRHNDEFSRERMDALREEGTQ